MALWYPLYSRKTGGCYLFQVCGVAPIGVTSFGTICGHLYHYGVYYGQGVICITGPWGIVLLELVQLQVRQVSRRRRGICLITNCAHTCLLITTLQTTWGLLCFGANDFKGGFSHDTNYTGIVLERGSTVYCTGLGRGFLFFVIDRRDCVRGDSSSLLFIYILCGLGCSPVSVVAGGDRLFGVFFVLRGGDISCVQCDAPGCPGLGVFQQGQRVFTRGALNSSEGDAPCGTKGPTTFTRVRHKQVVQSGSRRLCKKGVRTIIRLYLPTLLRFKTCRLVRCGPHLIKGGSCFFNLIGNTSRECNIKHHRSCHLVTSFYYRVGNYTTVLNIGRCVVVTTLGERCGLVGFIMYGLFHTF